MGEYHWKSYAEVDRLSACFAAGLTTLNLQRKEKICIFAETRAEWLIAAGKYFWVTKSLFDSCNNF